MGMEAIRTYRGGEMSTEPWNSIVVSVVNVECVLILY